VKGVVERNILLVLIAKEEGTSSAGYVKMEEDRIPIRMKADFTMVFGSYHGDPLTIEAPINLEGLISKLEKGTRRIRGKKRFRRYLRRKRK
jgi:hypothetical protein